MKKFAFFTLLIFFAAHALAQAEPGNYSVAVNKFKTLYNNNEADGIFNMFSPAMKTALPLNTFTTTTTQLKSQLGNLVKLNFIKYNDPVAVYEATFQHAVFLLNVALNDQDQFTGLQLSPQEDKAAASVKPDPDLTETPVSVKTLGGTISGTLTMPKAVSGKIPVVLIVAGSGPVDRNGNSVSLGINANTYKLLAYALGKMGYASVRYDKRLVGQSAGTTKEDDLRFGDYIDDAVGFIEQLNDDERFSKIIVAGHSEGSLVGMMASVDQPVKGFISLEGAGVPAEKILTEQMKAKPEYLSNSFKRVIDSLRRGKLQKDVDPALYYIVRPSIQQYLMSWCRYDPQTEIRKVKIPILLIQGTNDLEVKSDNGQKLKSAKSAATLTIVRGMNFVLKDAPAEKDLNLATYKDPALPLSTEMLNAVNDFIKGL